MNELRLYVKVLKWWQWNKPSRRGQEGWWELVIEDQPEKLQMLVGGGRLGGPKPYWVDVPVFRDEPPDTPSPDAPKPDAPT